MAETRNLCAQVPLELHGRVCRERERAGQTTSQYITQLLKEYYEMKENGGKSNMANDGSRTIPSPGTWGTGRQRPPSRPTGRSWSCPPSP